MKRWNKGKTYEELFGKEKAIKIKNKIRKSHLGKLNNTKGKKFNEIYGIEKSEEIRNKIRKMVKMRWCEGFYDNRPNLSHKKENNPSWKGGISKRILNSSEYIFWRKSVFERDNYTCKNCGKIGGNLEAHHIKSWAKYPELRLDINNGLTLCKKCHNITKTRNYKKGDINV